MNKTVNNFTRILYEHDKLGQLSSYDKIPPPHTITCYAKDPLQSHSQMTHLDSSSMSPTTSAGTRNRPLLPHFEHLLASLQVRKLIFILIPLIGWIIFFPTLFYVHFTTLHFTIHFSHYLFGDIRSTTGTELLLFNSIHLSMKFYPFTSTSSTKAQHIFHNFFF